MFLEEAGTSDRKSWTINFKKPIFCQIKLYFGLVLLLLPASLLALLFG